MACVLEIGQFEAGDLAGSDAYQVARAVPEHRNRRKLLKLQYGEIPAGIATRREAVPQARSQPRWQEARRRKWHDQRTGCRRTGCRRRLFDRIERRASSGAASMQAPAEFPDHRPARLAERRVSHSRTAISGWRRNRRGVMAVGPAAHSPREISYARSGYGTCDNRSGFGDIACSSANL